MLGACAKQVLRNPHTHYDIEAEIRGQYASGKEDCSSGKDQSSAQQHAICGLRSRAAGSLAIRYGGCDQLRTQTLACADPLR